MRNPCAIIICIALACGISGCNQLDVSVEETPIKVVEDHPGRGVAVKNGDIVTISYELHLESGAVVLADDSYSFEVGADAVIRGIDEAVLGMQLSGRRVVLCPPQKHWGRVGYGNGKIPPNETLTMDITVKAIR